jgi:ketosteroid isomerase-like protein
MKAVLIAMLLCAVGAVAQDQPPTGGQPSGGRIETATRGVVRYKGLENAIIQAEQNKDAEALKRFIADDFEVRSAEQNEPIPREVWEQQAESASLNWFQIRNVAVHEFGDTAIVSFLLDRRGMANGKAVAPTVFVVDVWRQREGKLAARYVSIPLHPAGAQLAPTGKQ